MISVVKWLVKVDNLELNVCNLIDVQLPWL